LEEFKIKKLIGGLLLGVVTLSLSVIMTNSTKVSANRLVDKTYEEAVQEGRQNELKSDGNPDDGYRPFSHKITKIKAKRTKSGQYIKITGSVKILKSVKAKKELAQERKTNYIWITTYKGDKFVKLSKHLTFKTTIKAPKAKRVLATTGYYTSQKHSIRHFILTSKDKKIKVTAYQTK